jgi:RNA polymerase sigma factor (sigma-70 family)
VFVDLPPDYRRVIRLARIEGLKIQEIAERIGKSRDSVKHLLARALDSLRAGFGAAGSSRAVPGASEGRGTGLTG